MSARRHQRSGVRTQVWIPQSRARRNQPLLLVPEAQGFGNRRAMLTTLENEAARRNVAELTLQSTESSHTFYLRLGFVDSDPARQGRFAVWAQSHCNVKLIVTFISTSTGSPFKSVGSYRHWSTASIAA